MTVDFEHYEVYSPGTSGLWRDLSRREAKAAFARLMAARPQRFHQLGALLEADGLELPPPDRVSDEELDAIGSWFLRNVSPQHEGSNRLLPEWYSVVNDLGLYVLMGVNAHGALSEIVRYVVATDVEQY